VHLSREVVPAGREAGGLPGERQIGSPLRCHRIAHFLLPPVSTSFTVRSNPLPEGAVASAEPRKNKSHHPLTHREYVAPSAGATQSVTDTCDTVHS
jgi:hypothetical protein